MNSLVTAIKLLILTALLLLGSFTTSYAQSTQLADQYWIQAEAAKKKGRYLEAAQLYEKSADAEKNSPNPRLENLVLELLSAGYFYSRTDQYGKVLKCYEEALAINRKLGDASEIATDLNNIGNVYSSLGQYDKALSNFREALAINRKLRKDDDIGWSLNNIGSAYYSQGLYDKALNNFKEALAINRKLGKEDDIATGLNKTGLVYSSWGQYDKALAYFDEALTVARKLGKEISIAASLSGIGSIYYYQGQYDKALRYLDEALEIDRKLGKEDEIATDLNNIGNVYSSLGQYDKALSNFREALAINRKLGKAPKIVLPLNNIGTVFYSQGQYDKALSYLKEALSIDRELEQEDGTSRELNNIGVVYFHLKKYKYAIENFNESVALKEKLRKTATGTARRDYLASQIDTYQFLTSAYLHDNDLPNAFKTMELSRAKLLAERLAGDGTLPHLPSVESIQQGMSTDSAIISFANSDRNDINPIALLITKENIWGAELDKKKFMESLQVDYKQAIMQLLANQRGLKVVKKSTYLDKKSQDTASTTFDDVINYYRSQLTTPSSGINRSGRGLVVKPKPGLTVAGENLDRLLYDFLIKPMAEHIKDKKRIIIIPDGVLSYLPFETLADEKNTYLVNRFSISYAQSMSVMAMLKKRNYPAGRKPMLAFGGAIYDEMSYTADMITDEKQLLALANGVNDNTRSKRAMGNAYASLGFAKWDNLPGTLSEVKAIAGTVKGAKIVTGRDVTENGVKRLSKSGELAKYKVIHYATHGIVVPELPELSAIVLSQLKNQPYGEDGYLRMDKIEQLKLKADFVNLSACETGLGKIFGGEGIVGLTQSFLLAGANGLSVSLWSVNDASTSKFMVALYNLVEQKKIGYGDAITEIKRDFIQGKFGEAYKSPYYWAPFVYYGR